MNDLELKYHIALQPLYRRVMGEWEVEDMSYNESHFVKISRVTHTDIHFWKMNPEKDNSLRIPLTIDDQNHRGLLDMLLGTTTLYSYGENLSYERGVGVSTQDGYRYVKADTLTLAILKALAYQEGIEI
ncbi:MAG: hypothetical protein WC373_11825 [Smithella sp.]|jgi:hypothetical protein